mgnify:FL=1
MKKIKYGRKLIIDISLIAVMILGAILYNKEIPGGLLLLFFSSVIYSILLLFGGFYLFKERKWSVKKLLSLPYGVVISVAPLSYSFRILDFPGYEVLTLYSRVIVPIIFILFLIMAIIKEEKNLKSFFIVNLLRLLILMSLSFYPVFM